MDTSGAVNIPLPDVSQDGLLHKTEPLHRRCLYGNGRPAHLSEYDPGRQQDGGLKGGENRIFLFAGV